MACCTMLQVSNGDDSRSRLDSPAQRRLNDSKGCDLVFVIISAHKPNPGGVFISRAKRRFTWYYAPFKLLQTSLI